MTNSIIVARTVEILVRSLKVGILIRILDSRSASFLILLVDFGIPNVPFIISLICERRNRCAGHQGGQTARRGARIDTWVAG